MYAVVGRTDHEPASIVPLSVSLMHVPKFIVNKYRKAFWKCKMVYFVKLL